MVGTLDRRKVNEMSPAMRYLENSRRYHAQRQQWLRRQAAAQAKVPTTPVETEPAKAQKGHCRHCGEHIGRGVAFHERKCRPSQT